MSSCGPGKMPQGSVTDCVSVSPTGGCLPLSLSLSVPYRRRAWPWDQARAVSGAVAGLQPVDVTKALLAFGQGGRGSLSNMVWGLASQPSDHEDPCSLPMVTVTAEVPLRTEGQRETHMGLPIAVAGGTCELTLITSSCVLGPPPAPTHLHNHVLMAFRANMCE